MGVRLLGSDVPSCVAWNALDIHQNAHQLRNAEGGMGVVHLDCHFRGETVPVQLGPGPFLETSNHVLDGRRAESVLLLQAEQFPLRGRVPWIQHVTDLASTTMTRFKSLEATKPKFDNTHN